jgi:hypothetical protein
MKTFIVRLVLLATGASFACHGDFLNVLGVYLLGLFLLEGEFEQ